MEQNITVNHSACGERAAAAHHQHTHALTVARPRHGNIQLAMAENGTPQEQSFLPICPSLCLVRQRCSDGKLSATQRKGPAFCVGRGEAEPLNKESLAVGWAARHFRLDQPVDQLDDNEAGPVGQSRAHVPKQHDAFAFLRVHLVSGTAWKGMLTQELSGI